MGYVEIIFLGVGLAVDASCVCTSNGLVYQPKINNTLKMAAAFAVFQFIMPLIGFFGTSLLPQTIYQYSHVVAAILLFIVGAKMLIDAYKNRDKHSDKHIKNNHQERESLFTNKILFTQAIATSIDALSAGFVFYGMDILDVVIASTIIAIVTFTMCFVFVKIGIYIGDKFNTKAEVFGGVVLVFLAIRILIT